MIYFFFNAFDRNKERMRRKKRTDEEKFALNQVNWRTKCRIESKLCS